MNQLGPFLSGMLVSGNIIIAADGGSYTRSVDAGKNFSKLDSYGSRHLHTLVYQHNGQKMFMYGDGIISVSADSGITWQKSYAPPTADPGCEGHLVYNDSGILISLGQQGLVCKSTDDGKNWTVTAQLSGFFENHKLLWTGTKFMAYAGNQDVVFESADGVTWSSRRLTNLFPFNQTVIFRNGATGVFYAYKYANTFSRSVDGITWTDLPAARQPPTTGGAEYMQNLAIGDVNVQPGHPCYK